MDSTLYRAEGKITATVDDFNDASDPTTSFVTLSFRQGSNVQRMTLPIHMSACAHMIVEAFNAHMEQPVEDLADLYCGDTTPFPTGAATSLGLAVALAGQLDTDEQAAHVVERRDLP